MILLNLLTIIAVCVAFHIATRPGEILSFYVKYINYEPAIPKVIKKLLTCAYCIAFWTSLIYILCIDEYVVYSFAVFISVYLITKQIQ